MKREDRQGSIKHTGKKPSNMATSEVQNALLQFTHKNQNVKTQQQRKSPHPNRNMCSSKQLELHGKPKSLIRGTVSQTKEFKPKIITDRTNSSKKILEHTENTCKLSHVSQSSHASKKSQPTLLSPPSLTRAEDIPNHNRFIDGLTDNNFTNVQFLKMKMLNYIFKNRIVKDEQFNTFYESLTIKFPQHEVIIRNILFEIVSSLDN